MAEKPLDRLAVRSVAELAGELKNPRSAQRWHPHSPAPAVHLRMPILCWFPPRPSPAGAVDSRGCAGLCDGFGGGGGGGGDGSAGGG